MSVVTFDDEKVVTATTVTFNLTATLNGAVWDLTGATVSLLLLSPAGVATTKSATLLVAASGTAYYTTLTTDITLSGRWRRAWQVVQGATVARSIPIPFTVVASP